MQNQINCLITFDTQFKTALKVQFDHDLLSNLLVITMETRYITRDSVPLMTLNFEVAN